MQDMTDRQWKRKSVPSPLCPRSRALREKVRMRGYKIKQLYPIVSPLPNPLPEGEGVTGTAVT
jgi:hypothetical protein